MTRCKIFNGIRKILRDDDIVFCVGKELVVDCKLQDRPISYCTSDTTKDSMSVALGIAMVTASRVFFICEDAYVLKHINTLLHASISQCSNFYVLVVVSKRHSINLIQPTLFDSIRSFKGFSYNLGILVHDYTAYLDNATSVKKLKGVVDSTIGPLVALINSKSNRLYNKNVVEDTENFDSISEFLVASRER